MKQLRFVLIFSAFALSSLHAQRGEPEPIPDFTNLEDIIYEPKTTLMFGMRSISGGKAVFRGQGIISAALENPGNATDGNIARLYHDGRLAPDSRIIDVERDEEGNPKLDENGATIPIPIVPDGKTNNWTYRSSSQSTDFPGFIAMHTYSAAVVDTRTRSKDANDSTGIELAVSRDMGRLFNSRVSWNLSAGMAINNISASSNGNVRAELTKLTDLYSLNGQAAPAAPYDTGNRPTHLEPSLDENGNPLFNEDGTPQQIAVADPAILLANSPSSRLTTVTTDETSVSTRSRLKGAYYTFRAGPTIWVPISNRFRLSLSLGATLVYAGTTYTVKQSYLPETGLEILDEVTSDDTAVLPGYYADASMQFDLTSRTGIYAGALFQAAGDFNQNITTSTANYSAKFDFGHQQGFRAGMSVKF
jgi:hypothetical protein